MTSVPAKLLGLLDLYSHERSSYTLSELSRLAGLPLTTTHRLVGELARWGALERGGDGRYRIGLRLVELGALCPRGIGLRDVALPYMEDLYEATHQNVQLAVRDGMDGVYIERIAGRHAVPVLTRIGAHWPLHATGVGLVLLAYAPAGVQEAVLAAPLPAFTPHTVTDPGLLRRILADVRRTGIATSDRQITDDAYSVGAPVTEADGSCVAALSVVVPASARDRASWGPAVRAAALGISRRLRHDQLKVSKRPRISAILACVLNAQVPNMARMYDYALGGKDNYAADREAVNRLFQLAPENKHVPAANRRFLDRAVRFAAGEGITQFLDLGAGLPSQGNVHEVARQVARDAHVIYVDNDPVVVLHANAMLGGAESDVAVVQADIRDHQTILAHPEVERLVDFSRPVAVLFVSVLHGIPDSDDPADIVRGFTSSMAPGSYLIVSHLTRDGHPPEIVKKKEEVFARSSTPFMYRSRAEILGYFDGFDLVEPGLVPVTEWRDDATDEHLHAAGQWWLGGVGRGPA